MNTTNTTNTTNPTPTRNTYYNHVDFVKGGRWMQTHNATPVRNYGPVWMTEVDGETLLAHSLKQINDALEALVVKG